VVTNATDSSVVSTVITDRTMGEMSRPSRRSRILVADDDPTISDVVARYLEREGFDVETVRDGITAFDRTLASPPDLMVLDLMLPGMDGLEVFRRLRAISPIPIIMLTARGDESDRVAGLELGADDYMGKPFSPRELAARVKSVLRRASRPVQSNVSGEPHDLSAGELQVDVSAREVRVGGHHVSLTAREFDLLKFFMLNPHHVFRREELLERVWGYTFGDTSTVTVHVRRLREKIEPDPSAPVHIQTVWGVGYRFEARPQEAP
jgi:DNA-binding response OmpR family regulator